MSGKLAKALKFLTTLGGINNIGNLFVPKISKYLKERLDDGLLNNVCPKEWGYVGVGKL